MIKFFSFERKDYIFALIDMEVAYDEALNGTQSIFFFEHDDIYSAGKSFDAKEFIVPPKLSVYFPNRGGKITVHSKGQLVVYPIINLKKQDMNVSQFVWLLEQWIIEVLKKIGLYANRSEKGRGVWVKDDKIGFIGINISKGVSKHGLCLNVSNNLLYFNSIIPCGLTKTNITSIEKLTGLQFDLEMISRFFEETCPFD